VNQVQAQVRHPGPVWLDRVEQNSLAPYGFGAELKVVLEERRECCEVWASSRTTRTARRRFANLNGGR
jgi:hypothetical protein